MSSMVRRKREQLHFTENMQKSLHVSVGANIYWHLYTKNERHETEADVIYLSSESQGLPGCGLIW